MFTTELVHRIVLTVLLLGALGNCANQQQEEKEKDQNQDRLLHHHHHHLNHHEEEQDQVKSQRRQEESQNLSSDKDDTLSFSSSSPSSLSRSIPSFETRNYHDYYRNRYRNRDTSLPSSSPSSSSSSSSSLYHPFESSAERRPPGSLSSSSLPSSSSAPEMSTVISSTSYSIKPGSSGSGSNVYINTKPTQIIISRNPSSSSSSSMTNSNGFNGGNKESSSSSPFSSYFNNPNNNPPRRGGSSTTTTINVGSGGGGGNSWDSGDNYYSPSSSTTDCFNGRNCPKGDDDEYKSYYSVLNGHLKYPERLGGGGGDGAGGGGRSRYDFDQQRDASSSGGAAASNSENMYHDRHATFPFHVHGIGPHNRNRFYPNPEDSFPKRRVTRTSTTSSPSWVKLQPIPAHKFYDPFLTNGNDASSSSSSASSKNDLMASGNEKYENVQFANRIGIELSPESFAERWGYGNGGSHGKTGGSGGSRLPSWLEELNHHHKLHHHNHHHHSHNNNHYSTSEHGRRPYGTAHSGPTRDEDPKNWVKLDPIPVAGVSISKWVPKGTAPSDLPSTGNLIRDKPSAWWDHRHHETHLPHLKPPSMGWGSSASASAFSNRYPSDTKRPSHGDPWKDIIYPDTPSSATASWEASAGTTLKGISTYPSSFPSSSSSSSGGGGGGGWKSDTRRPVVASWSAPTTSSSTNRFAIHRPGSGGQSYHIPSNYPDPQAHDDDPRWVLVSNSRRVSLAAPGHSLPSYSDRHKYRPSIGYRDDIDLYDGQELERDRDRDRLSYYKNHRLAKDYKDKKNPAQIQQDEAFDKVNATLQKLTPVLNHKERLGLDSSASSSAAQLSIPEGRLPTTTDRTTTTTTKMTSTTSRPPPPVTKGASKYNSFLSALIGDGRGHAGVSKNEANSNGTRVTVVNRKGNSMKPILAAVGAGMIPATLAAVLPMMGKRRKRQANTNNNRNIMNNYEENPSPMSSLVLNRHRTSQTPIVYRNQLYNLIPSSPIEQSTHSDTFLEKSRMNGHSSPFPIHRRHTIFHNSIMIPR